METMTTELTTPEQSQFLGLMNVGKETILDTFTSWLTKMDKSKDTYRYGVSYYLDWLKANGRTGTSDQDIIDFRNDLLKTKKPSTVSTYITAVRVFYKQCERKKIFPNIAAGIEGAKAQRGHRSSYLSVDEVKTLFATINRNTLRGKRDFAMINILIRTGLRGSELTGTNLSSIKTEDGVMKLFIKGKGRSTADDFVILTPATYEPLEDYLTARRIAENEHFTKYPLTEEELKKKAKKEKEEGVPLFIAVAGKDFGERLTTRSLSRIVKNYYYEAKILDKKAEENGIFAKDLCLHSTRHTAVTLCLKTNGNNIQEAQSFARHSDPKITLVYAHNLDRVENPPELKIDALLDN